MTLRCVQVSARALQSRAKSIVQFYTQKDGRPEDPAYFDNLARELSTYYGEPYGHSGNREADDHWQHVHSRSSCSRHPSTKEQLNSQ